MNELISYEAVDRTAPAKHGLFKTKGGIKEQGLSIYNLSVSE